MKRKHGRDRGEAPGPQGPTGLDVFRAIGLPIVIVVLAVLFVGSGFFTPSDAAGELRIHDFGKLPVVEHGRTKPIDTLARINLMLISRRTYLVDEAGNSQPAVRWLLDTVTGQGDDHQVFYIENDEVQSLLELPRRKGFRYSYAEIRPKLEELKVQEEKAEKSAPDLFHAKVIELTRRVRLYVTMRDLLNDRIFPKVRDDKEAMVQFVDFLKRSKTQTPHLIPISAEKWETFVIADVVAQAEDRPNATVEGYRSLRDAYAKQDIYGFNTTLSALDRWIDRVVPNATGRTGFEVFYNHLAPFSGCLILYGVAFLMTCVAWLVLPMAGKPWMDSLNRSAFWLLAFTLLFHSFGMISRMLIAGRPPVTNLYSSAVFIGWGAVGLGLVLEWIFKIGVGNLVAAVIGFLTCIVANFLAESGDTIEMLQAVLDTNFWLWTHVTCVTFGYTATFVAGAVGIVFVLFKIALLVMAKTGTQVTLEVERDITKILGQVLYGILCFATFLSFTGTVLGGIWADQSWGRFWGWDPKENGALLIVIWNALILHARWAGLAKTRGIALLAIVGNMITAWSWFGTNQLSVGLHAYGFNKELATGCTWFWGSQLFLLTLGLLPWDTWRIPQVLATGPARPDKKKPRDENGDGHPVPKADLETGIKPSEPALASGGS